ncbi:MAG: hypothetical protein A2V70_05325 [Planctomycetes bacterium RBG_13_63_9]|nr:MAG: hypothetical protein A2V70_05325 [Planctomycetes bacterium RBG_13_63_9]
MRRSIYRKRRHATSAAGFSLVEVMISTLLIGLVLVAALRCLGAALRAGVSTSRQGQAVLLAEGLMAEILQNPYLEPDDAAAWGAEGSAEQDGTRAAFDDVDDYDDWSASPPESKDGTVLSDLGSWQRTVTVGHVDPNDLSTLLADGDDQGVKVIRVEVSYDGEVLATLHGLQTEAWLDMIPEPDNDQTTGSRPQSNRSPVAVATGSPLSGQDTVSVDFDATGSTDPDGDSLTYAWDFGDGGNGSGATPSHTYSNPGEDPIVRTVTLTATDAWGASDTASLTVTIYGDD